MHSPTELHPSQPAGEARPTVPDSGCQQAHALDGACPALGKAQSYMAEATLQNRVGRVVQDLCAGREVADNELLQHARDCTFLMECAHDRFLAYGNPADREEAFLWMHRRDEALRSLSPAWKAAREALIQQAIAQGVGFFVEQGDAARVRLAGGRG